MKIIKIFVLLCIFTIVTYSQTGPKLEVIGGETINAGSFPKGHEVKYVIKFNNTGDQLLIIGAVSTSCGCSTALAASDSIPPGEEGSINFTFNGNGQGPVSKNVTISTNEVPANAHVLLITMNMVDPMVLNPASIMTSGKVGDKINQTITLQNSYDKEISIIGATANSPVVKINFDKTTVGSGESANFDISIDIFEDSPVNAAVTIRTSEGEYSIPIFVDIKAN